MYVAMYTIMVGSIIVDISHDWVRISKMMVSFSKYVCCEGIR